MELLSVFNSINSVPALGGVQAVVDGRGPALSVAGMLIVFIGLVVMMLVLAYLENAVNMIKNMFKSRSASGIEEEGEEETKEPLTGEEAAAICSALVLYHRMHMSERRQILTAESQLKQLSPWALSGKIHRTGKVNLVK